MNIAQKAFHALFSPPRSIPKSDNEDHNKSSANPRSARTSPRCEFTFSDGRQCRHPAKVYPSAANVYQQDELRGGDKVELSPVKKVRNQRASLCIHHARRRRTPGDEVAPDAGLEALCGDLTTATNINRALTQVFLLLAQGRIPQKHAVAFGYLSQLLLQTIPGIRSEFVSAFGYRQWEAKLKISLAPNSNEDPGPSGGENKQPMSPLPRPTAPPADSGYTCPPQDEPDYDSLYSRSLDLLDRKYDTTPEGRREANALALDLELMKPPDSKPPKGYFGQVVDLVRRLRARQQRKPAVAVNASRPSPAPAAPNAPIVPAPPAATVPNASSPASVPAAASAAPVNLPPPPVSRSEPSPAGPIKKPEAPDYVLPALAAKQAAPPPGTRVPPTRPTPAAPRPEAGPELPETKASLWDGRWRPPMPIDPLRHRATAFESKLRGMSNAGWRRWQHRNSRCF